MFRLLLLFAALVVLFASPAAAAINAPSALTGTWTPALLTLSWNDNSNNESGFLITYRVGGAGQFSILSNVAANVRTYSLPNPGADPCLPYQWAIFAFIGTAQNRTETSASSNVLALASPPAIVSPLSYASPLGHPFSYSIRFQCDGIITATSYAATSLPPGLSVNTATGLISGNPTTAGTFSTNLTVTYGSPAKTVPATLSTRIYQCQPVAALPPAAQSIPAQTMQRGGAAATFALGTWFTDPDATSAVRVVTTEGNMDFGFFGDVAPLTVTNFLSYVNRGDFVNSIFHRSVPGFVIQGGGFKATTPATTVPTVAPVQNEYLRSNLCGTVSMAKLGGDPNSATCQFFVSLDNNSANLDNQNGGFTVFGRVAGNGMSTAFAIARKPIRSWTALPGHSAFNEIPVTGPEAGDAYDAAKLVKVTSVTPIPHLTYTAQSSAPGVCAASVTGTTLALTPGGTTGSAVITITATDLDGLTVQGTMSVTIEENLATWLAAQNFPNAGDATALANPDGDTLPNMLEYGLLTDPQTHSPALTSGTTTVGADQFLTLTFPVRKLTGIGFRYAVESHNELTGAWTEIWKSSDGFAHVQVVSSTDQSDRTNVTIRDTAAIAPGGKHFLRLRVTDTP